MSKNYKQLMAEAIAADKAAFGTVGVYDVNQTFWTDNAYHVEEQFEDDRRYIDALSSLHETEMFSMNLDDAVITDPRQFADYVKEVFGNVVNSSGGLNLRPEMDFEDDTITVKYYNQDDVYVGSGSLYNGNIDTSMFQSHRVMMDSLKHGIRMQQMEAAIEADKETYGVDFDSKVTFWTDNEYHVDERFSNDVRYTDALSMLHETEMFSMDLNDAVTSSPKQLASRLRDAFGGVVNNLTDAGLRPELELEGGTITAKYYNQNGEYVGSGYLYGGNIKSSGYQSYDVLMETLAQGIAELQAEEKDTERFVASIGKQREQIIEAGPDVYVSGDSSEDYLIEINEANINSDYVDLEESEIHQDIYSSTYLRNVKLESIQEFAKIFESKKGAKYGDTVMFAGEGNIDSYGTIACDTDVRLMDNYLTMNIRGYDRKSGDELFTAVADAQPWFGTYSNNGAKMADDITITWDDLWPQNAGLMKLDGRNPEQVIKGLPVLCDKRNVEIDGDTLRIPMSEATAYVMKQKGMIYGFEPIDKDKAAQMTVGQQKLNNGLLTEKESQVQAGLGE